MTVTKSARAKLTYSPQKNSLHDSAEVELSWMFLRSMTVQSFAKDKEMHKTFPKNVVIQETDHNSYLNASGTNLFTFKMINKHLGAPKI